MPYFIAAGSRLPLPEGETRIGGPQPSLDVPGLELRRAAVLIWLAGDGRATARRLDSHIEVELYGRELDDEPRPLAHGAKLVIAGKRLAYVDERAAGTTRSVAGVPDDALLDDPLAKLGERVATAATGGRLITLRDGRKYPIPEAGVDIGRDPNCDIVLTDPSVSRWHAAVAPGLLGYSITDSSSNGVLVDGARVEGSRVLGQGNVIRIGSEELRFEADEASFEPLAEGWATGAATTDASSRNGSHVDGERVYGEARLAEPCELRFGNVKLVFRPLAGGAGGDSGTRAVVGPPTEPR